MAHPLGGADPATILRALRAGGAPDHWGAVAGVSAMALARAPASALERLLVAPRLADPADMAPPVFILGHWRSGTTHLYNVMSCDEAWAYVSPAATGLPWDMFGLARIFHTAIERALPRQRWIDRMPVTPTSPQEDEVGIAAMTDLSFFHGIYFPRHFDELIERGLFFDGCSAGEIARWERCVTHFLAKVALAEGGRPLLVKNPAHTARVARLRHLFPRAKFIHIHRNPLEVFLSMRNFYARLLEHLALQDTPAGLDIDETILHVYDRMMDRFVAATQDLPPDMLVEISHAELDADPLATVARVYDELGLDGFEAARPACAAYLADIRGYQRNAFTADPATVELVARRWGRWFEYWGYDMPAVAP